MKIRAYLAVIALFAASPAIAELQLCDDDIIEGNSDWILFDGSWMNDPQNLPCDVQFQVVPPLDGNHTAYLLGTLDGHDFESLRFSASLGLSQLDLDPADIWTFMSMQFQPPHSHQRLQFLFLSLIPFPSMSGYAVEMAFDEDQHAYYPSRARTYPLSNLQDGLSAAILWEEPATMQISLNGGGLNKNVLIHGTSRRKPMSVAVGLISDLEFPIPYSGISVVYPVVTFNP